MPYKSLEDQRAHRKERYWRDREKAIADVKRWREENPEKRNAWEAAHRETNREELRTYQQKWREQNREHVNEAARKRPKVKRIRPKHKEYLKGWHQKNKTVVSENARKRYLANREVRLANRARYVKENHDKILCDNRLRRARERNAEGTHTAEDVQAIWIRQGKKCAVPECCHPISDQKGKNKYHVDHIVALVNGGSNWPENLQILCAKHNMQKHTR
jgi:hypothetical protein